METSEQPTLAGFEDESLSSAQACHASQVPLPESGEARAMTVGSGRQLSMLLDRSNPLGAFSRILLESLHWTSSAEFCYVWNRLDTKFALSAFQLTPLGLSTDGNGCSLWPTAHANCSTGAGTQGRDGGMNLQTAAKLRRTPNANIVTGGGQDGQKRLDAGHAMQLSDQVMSPKLWPTPVVNDARNGRNETANRSNPDSQHHSGTTLSDAVRLWPAVQCGKNNASPSQYNRNSDPLDVVAAKMSGCASGSLNPRFVEELMGFPIDHTALKRSETPSARSRRSPFSRPLPKLKGSRLQSGQNGALDETGALT
jgi:hypothetical protein